MKNGFILSTIAMLKTMRYVTHYILLRYLMQFQHNLIVKNNLVHHNTAFLCYCMLLLCYIIFIVLFWSNFHSAAHYLIRSLAACSNFFLLIAFFCLLGNY